VVIEKKSRMSNTRKASAARKELVNNSLLAKSEEKQKLKEIEKSPKIITNPQTPKQLTSPKSDFSTNGDCNGSVENSEESESWKVGLEKEFDKFRGEIKDLFKQFDNSIDKKLERFEDKFSNVLKEFQLEMKTIRQEVNDTKSDVKEMKTKMREVEESVAFHSQDAEERELRYEAKLRRTQTQLEELERKFLLQEKHDRRYNLLFYGFQEETNEDLGETMKSFFKSKLEIEEERVANMVFANLHRIPSESKGPKPVIVKFAQMMDRDLVYSKALHPILREEKRRILSDLPVIMNTERGRLAKKAYEIRRDEKLKTRIQENGLAVYLEVRKTKDDSWERRDV
jgi:hypothetical protein